MIVVCSENEAYHAYQMFNGRWYSGRQIQCSFTSVDKWKPAICGELVISRTRFLITWSVVTRLMVNFLNEWRCSDHSVEHSVDQVWFFLPALESRWSNSNAGNMYQTWSKHSVQHMNLPLPWLYALLGIWNSLMSSHIGQLSQHCNSLPANSSQVAHLALPPGKDW